MILRPDARAMMLRRIIRAPTYSHPPMLPLSIRAMIPSWRAVSSNSKKPPLAKSCKEIPIIGSDGKPLFESLGITGRLKMVALAIFAVLATIESMFWVSMLWNKYGWREDN
jgi:hypothetical protein